MLRVEDERNIHTTTMLRTRLRPMEQRQEMAGQILLIRIQFDSFSFTATVAIPVAEHGWQGSQEAFRDLVLLRKILFRLEYSKHRSAGAQNVHWMRVFRDLFQYLFQGRRKKSEFFKSSVELPKLLPIRQLTLEQKK